MKWYPPPPSFNSHFYHWVALRLTRLSRPFWEYVLWNDLLVKFLSTRWDMAYMESNDKHRPRLFVSFVYVYFPSRSKFLLLELSYAIDILENDFAINIKNNCDPREAVISWMTAKNRRARKCQRQSTVLVCEESFQKLSSLPVLNLVTSLISKMKMPSWIVVILSHI